MKIKKVVGIVLSLVFLMVCFIGCGSGSEGFDKSKAISVISREEGSGTRGAFVELFGIEQKDEDGNKVDYTIPSAGVTNNTSVMMSTVSGNLYAVGYISLGSLNDSVKAVRIDGAEATVDNIKNGSYGISRPFNIVTGENISEAAQDFIDFIMSSDGQAIVEAEGYIQVSDAGSYSGDKPEGKIVVAGSSSVSPVMEKLQEAYLKLNPNAKIELQTSDSTTGVESAISGICDIGMASRELKEEEESQGVSATVIAMDGIAVIVNNDNTIEELTSEQVMNIYTGNITRWSEISE